MSTSRFVRSAVTHEMPHPFGDELATLNAIPPGAMLGHETERAKKLRTFDQVFQVENRAYKAASASENWPAAASISERVLKAAQAIAAGAFILLFLASSAPAQQTLPQEVSDPASSENMLYLDQKIRELHDSESENASLTDDNIFSGTVTFNGAVVFNTPISVASATYVTPGSLNAVLILQVCYATVTFTLPVAMSGMVWHSGTVDNGSADNQCKLAYLIDGALPSRFTKDIGLTATVGANEINASFVDDLPTLAAGEHVVCLAIAAQTGGGGVCTWPSAKFIAVQSINRFGVRFSP